jgi:Fic-DOC domain mobile mystery protein B
MTSEDEPVLLEGATPIDPDEAAGLIPGLTTRNQLNSFEQANIAKAVTWSRRSRKIKQNLLSVETLKLLHKQMFDETWTWAGKFRTTGKNIGVEPYLIQNQLANLCADAKYWIENKTFPLHVCAVRFHHRLVSIHPFPNGNGRHSRLAADLIMINTKQPTFTWGGQSLDVEGSTRAAYLAALREADQGRYEPLLAFAQRT